MLGIAGARVVGGELPVARAQDVFDDDGRLPSPLVAERLRSHLAALVDEAAPLTQSRPEPKRRGAALPRPLANGYQRWIGRGASGTSVSRRDDARRESRAPYAG